MQHEDISMLLTSVYSVKLIIVKKSYLNKFDLFKHD